MDWLSFVREAGYYTVYPILFLLKLLLYILDGLATPFLYIGSRIGNIVLLPWRIFAQFEAIWYFLGAAVFLGVLLGVALHFTMRAFVLVFDLESTPATPKPMPEGHNAISYRAARAAKRQKQLEEQTRLATQARLLASRPLIQEVVREARNNLVARPLSSPLGPNTTAATRSGLQQETILEQTDEEDDDDLVVVGVF